MSQSPSPIVVAMAFLTAALQLTEHQTVAVLLPQLGGLWPGEDPAQLLAAYALGAAVLPLGLTACFPGCGGRYAVAGGLATLAVADLWLWSGPGFGVALGLRALAGGASGIVSFALLATVSSLSEGRSRAVAAMTTGFLVALVVGVPAAALLVDAFGVLPLFAGLGAAALVLGAGTATSLPPAPPRPPGGSLLGDLAGFLLRPGPLLYGLLASVLIAAAIGGPVSLFSRHLQTGPAGLSLPAVATVYFVAGLGPILGGVLAPRIVARHGTRRTATLGATVLVLPLLLLSWAGASAPRAALFLGLALVLETVRRSALQEHVALLATPANRNRYLSLRNLLANLGVALGILAATRLEARFGFAAAGGLGAALALASAGATAATASRSS